MISYMISGSALATGKVPDAGFRHGTQANNFKSPSGIVNRITGIGYLVRTGSELVRTGTYLVQTGTGNV